MAIQDIVLSIDAYIARLMTVRDLLSSSRTESETKNRKPRNRSSQGKQQSIPVSVPTPGALQVAIQTVPARVPRQRHRSHKPDAKRSSALGGPVPEGPVVIRSSELAHRRSESSQARPASPPQRPTASGGGLEDLAQEVSRRLASGGNLPHRI